MDKGRSDFERDLDRAVDSPNLSAEDGDMTSAEDSSDLEWDVFLGSSPESNSSSLESTIFSLQYGRRIGESRIRGWLRIFS